MRRYFDNPSIHTLKLERLAKGWARPPDRTVISSYGLIGWHPDRDARPRALLSSCLAEITAEVVSPGPSKLPKAATPMV
jgi:hypothetical protein